MANYGINYRLDFCEKDSNRPCRIDILKRDYSGDILPFVGGKEPMSIVYKNDSDNKFEQITNSQATVNLVTSETLTLNNFYTGDEREYKIILYIESALAWSGFVMPDSAKEPFLTAPYNASLKATDLISTLSSIPYTDDLGRPIKKIDNIKNILSECLNKTGLNLDLFIGVNTYEDDFLKGDNDCPLEQTYIDTNRFIDTNNKPYSCFDIIKSFCTQFTSNIKQVNGAWWLVDINQLREASYRVRQFDYSGVKVGNQLVSNVRKAGLNLPIEAGFKAPLTLVERNHDIQNIPGYKSVTTYYQYGYLSNKLINGDLNNVTPGPLLCPFENWTSFDGLGTGGMSIGWGEKTEIIDNTGIRKPNGDKYAIINNYDGTKPILERVNPNYGMFCDSVSVLETNSINISVGVASSIKLSNLICSFMVEISAPTKQTHFWNGQTWVTAFDRVKIFAKNTSKDSEVAVSFSMTPPPFSGRLTLTIHGAGNAALMPTSNHIDYYFNNISIQFDENSLNKSPLGLVSVTNQVNDYSESPDPVVIMFGDDNETQRTSWMRNSAGIPTGTWNGGKTLQNIVGETILTQYQKVSRLFEGSFKGGASPLDITQIDLTGGSFFFLSGEFYIKSGHANLTLAELFINDLTPVNYTAYLDYGDFKGKDGNGIGSPSGVSIPPANGGADLSNFVTKDGYNKADWDAAFSWGNHAGKYPTYDGAGAIGEWDIDIKGNAKTADFADDSDKWDGKHFPDYLDQPVRKTDGVEFLSVVADTVNSKSYVSGFSGIGYKINPDGSAEFDSVTIRKDLNINTLNVREITGSGGSLAITNVAKIFSVSDEGTYYRCAINTDDSTIAVQLRLNDIIRCQIWDGKKLKYYSAIVTGTAADAFTLSKASFVGGGVPEPGDTVFQFGNTTDVNRQGLIYITNSDTGAPYLDILDGVNSGDLTGKTKVRLGKLDGINDPVFGQLSGYGLYGRNAYLRDGNFSGSITVTGGNAETLAGAQAKADAAQDTAVSISAADASAKVDGIVVGGRNLLLNYKGAPSSPGYYYNDPEKGSVIVSSVTPTFWYGKFTKNIAESEMVTFSISCRCSSGSGNVEVYFNGWNGYKAVGIISTEWKTLSVSVIVVGGVLIEDVLHIRFDTDDLIIEYIKLEIGNKATDGSPAPEDVTAQALQAATDSEIAAKTYADAKDNLKAIEAAAYTDNIVDAEEARAIADAQAKLALAYADATAKANAAQTAAQNAAFADAQIKADNAKNDAENAAKIYADAQDLLKATAAAAYTDGAVSIEEQARINDANAKLWEAKSDATAKANAAEQAAKDAAAIDATNKANSAKSAAELAAKNYADSQDALKAIQAAAYADGVVSVEEAARIADANAKLLEAKADATTKAGAARDAAQLAAAADASAKVNAIVIGGRNLLLNYKGAPSSPGYYYNDPEKGSVIVTSNTPVYWVGKFSKNILANEIVTFSISCRCSSSSGDISVYLNGSNSYRYVGEVNGEWKVLSVTFAVIGGASVDDILHIAFQTSDLIIEYIKLEIGNKVTDGSPAPEDVSSDATNKANTAQSNAIASANAAAETIATSKANIAEANAVATASSDATGKAEAARIAAENASNAYAATVANSAASAAQIAAAADASNKATDAYNNAVGTAAAAQTALTNQLKNMAYTELDQLEGITTINKNGVTTIKLDAAYVRANVVNADYVTGLDLNFTHGVIGGWDIGATKLFSGTNPGNYIELQSGSSPQLYMKNASHTSGEYSMINSSGIAIISNGNSLPTAYGNYNAVAAFKLKPGAGLGDVALYCSAPPGVASFICEGDAHFTSISVADSIFTDGNQGRTALLRWRMYVGANLVVHEFKFVNGLLCNWYPV